MEAPGGRRHCQEHVQPDPQHPGNDGHQAEPRQEDDLALHRRPHSLWQPRTPPGMDSFSRVYTDSIGNSDTVSNIPFF